MFFYLQLADSFFGSRLRQLPPFYRREQEIVCVAVGSSALQFIRDEQDLIASILGEGAADEEGKTMAAIAAAVCEAVDMVSDILPDTVAGEENFVSVPMPEDVQRGQNKGETSEYKRDMIALWRTN